MLRDQIAALIQSAMRTCGIDDTPQLTHPALGIHGDFSTNIAMRHAKKLGVSPIELARQIIEAMGESDLVYKVALAPPGFINITLTSKALLSSLANPTHKPTTTQPKAILLEFGQPNTHKMPHIGHLFSYIYGESLARILTSVGHSVKRANYQGDIGPHVARCLWTVQKQPGKIATFETLAQKVAFLQECYQEGSKADETNALAQQEIRDINKSLYIGNNKELTDLWQQTRAWCVEYYKMFEESLDIHFDKWYFETDVAKVGLGIVNKHTPDIFTQSEGAVVFAGEQYGLHTRVFINKFGNPTYEAKELGLAFAKTQDFDFDLSLTTTATEQNEYFKVVYKAAQLIDPMVGAKLNHIGYGMINLTSGKMSSRTGNIVTAMSLVNDDVTNKILADYYDLSPQHLNDARTIALAAIKYAFLQSDYASNKTFDVEKSVAREGDSGPYLLYTHVRTHAILQQTPDYSLNDVLHMQRGSEHIELHEAERAVLALLYRFPEVVEAAAQSYAPHHIANFAYSLCQAFNVFYHDCPIIKAEDDQTRAIRLGITMATGKIIKQSLHLLGIQTVDKM